jgi:hypothetical protein
MQPPRHHRQQLTKGPQHVTQQVTQQGTTTTRDGRSPAASQKIKSRNHAAVCRHKENESRSASASIEIGIGIDKIGIDMATTTVQHYLHPFSWSKWTPKGIDRGDGSIAHQNNVYGAMQTNVAECIGRSTYFSMAVQRRRHSAPCAQSRLLLADSDEIQDWYHCEP